MVQLMCMLNMVRLIRFNRDQKDSLAKLLEGFAIASGIAVYTYFGGKLSISIWEALVTAFMGILCESLALIIRRE